ncbi:ATP-binding protein [Burkholderia pseudomallei]|uniref:AAA family ATPase n=1 Tax=Burkholderia TaxID=32008 RepID=UPI00034C170B|nr:MULTISPECIES: ATP-binding protein [Burkholderia]ANW48802.1 DNA transposition protein [Burkholderia pseudomallei]ANW54844.1 DNA transposition protein [Burkholderia pseudomallei]MCS6596594.1 ATP-binding protein [Burkholderia pseudomallei]MCT7345708.1 ATP-binding protein [Burkholderia pseudomallei]MCT7916958.1 ATP-binding protein [Burkholderia pseudomallei]
MTQLESTLKPIVSGVAQITNLNLCDIAIERAVSRSANLPGLVCFYGPSGYGKSMAANYVANARRARYVQAKSVWTKKHFLKAILFEMGIKPGGTIPEMADQVAEELAASGRPLIIDEMDHLVDRNAVELVRDLYESSQAPILMIGEEALPIKLKKWERMHGRVLAWVPAQPVTIDDARQLATLYCRHITVADDLLTRLVELAHGSVRRVCVNLERIQEEALMAGKDAIDLAQWGKRELYTGEAPKRRV